MLPGELILVGGRPGNGKTALALSIAMNVARSGKRVAIFSLEMSKAQLTRRALAMASQVNVHALLKGDLNGGAWKQFVKAAGDISSYQLLIDDWNGLTPQQMQSSIRNLQNGYGKVDLVILDYVQLMTDEDERANRVQQISAISRALKVIANTYNIPVVAISSLSRAVEQRDNKRPVLSDLRDSGQLEFDADKVFFIYRDEVYNETTEFPNQAEIIIAKHRNGPTGTIALYFEKTTTKFCNAAERSVDLSRL
jgi:replicative DNA helicase